MKIHEIDTIYNDFHRPLYAPCEFTVEPYGLRCNREAVCLIDIPGRKERRACVLCRDKMIAEHPVTP